VPKKYKRKSETPKKTPLWKQTLKVLGASAGIVSIALGFYEWRTDQRPYVTIDGAPQFVIAPNISGSAISANIYLKDSGKTTATKAVWVVDLLPYRATSRPAFLAFVENSFKDLERRREALTSGRAHELNREISSGTSVFSTMNSRALSSSELTDLEKCDGSFILLSIGIVTYQGDFLGKYQTEFCYFFVGTDPKVWHICDSHNTVR
jgi:hypothetical protein